MITVRNATQEDYPAIKELLKAKKKRDATLGFANIDKLINKENWLVALAFHEKKLVGLGTAEKITPDLSKLVNGFVHPNYRGNLFGGEKVIGHLLDYSLGKLFDEHGVSKASVELVKGTKKEGIKNFTRRGFNSISHTPVTTTYLVTKENYMQAMEKRGNARK